MTNEDIAKKLVELGGNEWKKGEYHRIYIDGYDVKNLLNNEHAYFGKTHTIYFNVNTGLFAGNRTSKSQINNANILLEEWLETVQGSNGEER